MPVSKIHECWFSFSINPIKHTVTILGVAGSRDEAIKHYKRADKDSIFCSSFDMVKKESPQQLHNWLLNCGIFGTEAVNILREIGKIMLKIMDETS